MKRNGTNFTDIELRSSVFFQETEDFIRFLSFSIIFGHFGPFPTI